MKFEKEFCCPSNNHNNHNIFYGKVNNKKCALHKEVQSKVQIKTALIMMKLKIKKVKCEKSDANYLKSAGDCEAKT